MIVVNPLAGVVTSSYDLERVHPTLRDEQGRRRVVPHLGSDAAGRPRGITHPIVAPVDGTVLAAYGSWQHDSPTERRRRRYLARLTGNHVVIEAGNGHRFYLGHLERVHVTPGQHVRAGDVIGTQGATGDVSGAHLHLEVWVDGQPVDPEPYFATAGAPLGTGPTDRGAVIMARLDPDDYTAIAKHVWAHGPKGRNAWDILDRTNQAVGRLDGAVPRLAAALGDLAKTVAGLPGAILGALTPSGRPLAEVVDKTNHAVGRLEGESR